MDGLFHFLSVVVICAACLIGLALVLLVAVFYLPDSPLRQVVSAITKRIGATALITLVAVPVEAIPVVDVAYDLGGVIFLLYYWFSLIRAIRNAFLRPARPAYRQSSNYSDIQGVVIDDHTVQGNRLLQ